MSWNARRASIVVLALIVAVSAVWLDHGRAQLEKIKGGPIMPAPPGADKAKTERGDPDGFLKGGITLVKDDKGRGQKIAAILDYIDDGKWDTAVDSLQQLLKMEEDVFVRLERKNDAGDKVYVWVSAKQEADRIVAKLPKEGMDWYKEKYGKTAADMLKKAKETGDAGLLAQIMKLYAHTDAGLEAIKLLGDYKFDRGDYNDALLCYTKLIARQGEEKVPVMVLAKAAWAAHVAPPPSSGGQNVISVTNVLGEKELWKMLRGRTREVPFGEQAMPVDDLEEYVAKLQRSPFEQNASDITVYRATPSRGNQLIGGPAFMSRLWGKDMLYEYDEKSAASQRVKEGKDRLQGTNQPIIPAFAPLALTVRKNEDRMSLVVYKDYHGVIARDLRSGKLMWASPSTWSVQRMLSDSGGGQSPKAQAFTSWWSYYQQQLPQILFENSTVNTLSTDGQYVYFVEDFAVPPTPQAGANPWMGGMPQPQNSGNYDKETQEAINHSKLYALDLARGGKLSWQLGEEEKGPLSDSFFLGPPLPLAGKLYLLAEKQQEVRLICLEPSPPSPNGRTPPPKVLSIQTLGLTEQKMQNDVFRRTNAAHLAYGEGILVCPTNAGAIFGVNLLENSLVWAYPYRDKGDQVEQPEMPNGRFRQWPPPGFQIGPDGRSLVPILNQRDHWKASTPIIADGKVVFTAPDARSVHCVNLRDGSPVWKRPKQTDDLYLGNVHNGKVLIVGKKSVRALSLSSGDVAWSLETGMPSGQGIGSDNVYYLPLRDFGKDKQPRILGIDMDNGKIVSQGKSRKRKSEGGETTEAWEVPGNLLFHDGKVISLTADEIVAYPQLKSKIAEMDERIAKNPNDPLALTERGDLRLDKGDLSGAIDDLSTALKNNPDKETRQRARAKLYDTLTAYISDHFNQAEKYLDEYKELCKLDIDAGASPTERDALEKEQRRRRATFLWLVGKGREEQGRLVEAFENYQQFGAEAGKQSELVPAVDDRQVKAAPDVWSRGRIIAMLNNAKPEHRAPLEKLIADKWSKLRDTNDLNELRGFVRMFGSVTEAGKEARLELVERLMERKDAPDEHPLLEAELELNQFRTGRHSAEIAARATEALARLYVRKGLLEDAAYCYRKLGKEYAKIVIRDGKTGQQLYDDEAATDKRLIPYLDDPLPLGSVQRFGGKKESEGARLPGGGQLFQFAHSGERLPFFRHHIVGLNFSNRHFTLLDRNQETDDRTPRVVWSQPLSETDNSFQMLTQSVLGQQPQFNRFIGMQMSPNYNPHSRFPYATVGHLIVLPLGQRVYGIDPVNHKKLWEKDLSAGAGAVRSAWNPGNPLQQQQQFPVVDPRDGSVLVPYNDNFAQRVGQVSPFEGQTICVQTIDRLNALDPLTGRVLWSRENGCRNYLFSDEDYVFVVELDATNNVTSSRVFRAADGISVKTAPDFSTLFPKRLQVFGRYLLLSDTSSSNGVVARLYDIVTGKDVWKQSYPAGSKVASSEDATLTAVIEPEGKVHVIDLKARKEVMTGELWYGASDVKGVHGFHLLRDREYFYLATQDAPDKNGGGQFMGGGWQPPNNVMTQWGMRTVPVHGKLHAFKRKSGEYKWGSDVKDPMYLILDRFEESPVVFLTVRRLQMRNVGPGMVQPMGASSVHVLAIHKNSGRANVDFKDLPGNTGNFFGARIDTRSNTVELLSQNLKIVLSPAAPKPDGGKKAKPSGTSKSSAPKDSTAIGSGSIHPGFDRAQIREIAPPGR
jgi:outer membrane protein assembly factor BamB/tetratricopeptide (TPR) repeat protein